MIEQWNFRCERGIKNVGLLGDTKATADAIGEIDSDLVLFIVHESSAPWQASGYGRKRPDY
ncbi:hypothetical protein D3C76_1473860 [compost metagenome]